MRNVKEASVTSISNFKSLAGGSIREKVSNRADGYMYIYKPKKGNSTQVRVKLTNKLVDKARFREGDKLKLGYDGSVNTFTVSLAASNEVGSKLRPILNDKRGKTNRSNFNISVNDDLASFFHTFADGKEKNNEGVTIEPKEVSCDRGIIYLTM